MLKANKLTLTVEKSKLLCFDLSPVCKNNVIDVYINVEPLPFNSEAKYLGVIIDLKVARRQHIENIKNKINNRLRILKQCVSFCRNIHLSAFLILFKNCIVTMGP